MKIAYIGIKRHPPDLRELILSKIRELDVEIETSIYEDETDQIISSVQNANAIFLAPARYLPEEVFDAMNAVQLIQIWSSGYDKFNLKSALNRGILVANNGGYNSIAVAEQAILLILALYKRIIEGYRRVTSGKWAGNRHGMNQYILHGKSIGIIGLGNIGSKVAILASSFGMNVFYYDINRNLNLESKYGFKYVDIDHLYINSDIISLHLHLNEDTINFIDSEDIKKMKKGVVIINVSRAELINRDALTDALIQEHLGGLGLDVFYEEPTTPNDPLLLHPNFVGTPHSSCTYDTHVMAIDASIQNIRKALNGEKPDYLIST